jgi:O-antigen/teichoic acid export membrane protein
MTVKSSPAEGLIVRLINRGNSLRTKILSQISKDPLLKGIVIIGSGTVVAQVLSIVFVPILTRIYPPAIYGTLAVFASLLSILIIASSFRYDLTLTLTEKDDDAEYLLILCFFIVCILTVILFVTLELVGDFLAGIFHFEFIKPYYWLFSVGFFGISVYQILNFWALRSKDYITITRTRIAQSISGSVSKIILGIFAFGSFGLIVGEIIGRIVGITTLGRTILPKVRVTILNLDGNKLKALAYQYRRFPAFSLPASFINELSLQVPTLFISGIFGFQIVGLYALTYSMLVLPVSLVSSSIGAVFVGESSELYRQRSGGMLTLYQETTKKLFLFGAPIIMTGAVISPLVFPLIFGSAWKDAGMFSLPLSIMIISNFVVSSTDRLELYGFNHWELYWNISRTIFVFAGFYISYVFGLQPVPTVLIFSSIMTVMYIILYILNINAIGRVLKNENIQSP